MTENYQSIVGMFEAIKNKLECTGDTPVKCITPAEFRELCTAYGIGNGTAYLLATFAMSLARGMMQEPGTITAIVDGANGGTMGAELITQVESLRNI